jgi:hypothetical protein
MKPELADEAIIHETLLAAVPPLPEPPDRLAQVGLRVRRARRRVVVASALAVALILGAVGGAFGLAGEPRRDPRPAATASATGNCPEERPVPPSADPSGPLVPPGAFRATLCESKDFGPSVEVSARTLTQHVDQLVSVFNELPDPAAAEAATRARFPDAPPGTAFGVGCNAAYFPPLWIVFQYPDQPPLLASFNRNCLTVETDEHTRVIMGKSPLDTFDSLYRAQLRATTRPADVRTPVCPATTSAAHLQLLDTKSEPRDDIGSNRGSGDPFLPDPLVAAAACRYKVSGDKASLATQVQRRTDLDPLRGTINDATAMLTVQPSDLVERMEHGGFVQPMTDCGYGELAVRPELVDILMVADATGAVSEVRVWRRPCLALMHGTYGGIVPTEKILSTLDQLLGPPS